MIRLQVLRSFALLVSTLMSDIALDAVPAWPLVVALEVLGMAEHTGSRGRFASHLLVVAQLLCHRGAATGDVDVCWSVR